MTVFYVSSGNGSDSNAGSAAAPLSSLQQAANRAKPGDTVRVMSGAYTAPPGAYDVLDIRTSGTASAPIVFEAAAGQHPVIDSSGHYGGIVVEGASYITISGFEVKGNAASLTQAYALAHQGEASTSTKGIAVWVSKGATPTHVTIQNNIVHDQPGAGIWAGHGDYISILGNTAYRNAFWSSSADSGISVGWMVSTDANTGYKTIVAGNTVYDNRENIPWSSAGKITDGNGIIVDSDNLTGYNGRTLVANNVAYGNGGTGAHAYNSNNVDFFYNTAYRNNQTASLQEGQIVSQASTGNRIENNILVAAPGGVVNQKSPGVTYDYNVYDGGTVATQGVHDIVASPRFLSPAAGNFALAGGSPALGNANATLAQGIGSASAGTSGSSSNRGASLQAAPANAPQPATDTLVLQLSADLYQGPPQFIAALDGHQLGAAQSVTARNSLAETQSFTFSGQFGSGPHDLAVSFLNDAYAGTPQTDRNLFVKMGSFDGHQSIGAATLYSAGTVHFPIPSAT